MSNLIHKKLIEVMASVDAITKNRKNPQQGYNFRGIDDVMNELHVHFAKQGIFIMPEVIDERREQLTNQKGTTLLYSFVKVKYTFYAEDGSSVSAIGIGEAMDSGDKATNKAQSSALKYVLLQSLLIPTEEPKDVENDSPQLASKPSAKLNGEVPAGKEQIYPSVELMHELQQIRDLDGLKKHWEANKDRHEDPGFKEAMSVRRWEVTFKKQAKVNA